ncbi:PAP2 superfamily protein [Kineococcus xinjiangensis]|uniref:PAP2 superfamily protein n=1 Tax=Kineococcus xinjiangensis TaxID=512762 RepID=A0A2S6IG26_9ACTN|nr:phosphatase PAP2 family protein [Kineococcus xinjiangensis]PPK93174.1 PAP2 superfamily protein [Kineococcus xinjiangensis]
MLAETPMRAAAPTGPRTAAGLAAAATALLASLAVLYAVCVLTPVGQRHEDAVHSAAGAGAEGTWPTGEVLTLLGLLSPAHLLAGLALVAVPALLRRRPLRAGVAAGVVLVAVALTELLKLVVLPRPGLAPGTGAALHNSLPSGHASAAVALVLALLLVVPARWRLPVGVVGGAAAAAVAGAVVDAGWHRVSDVLASVLLATAVWCAGGAVLARAERWPRAPEARAVAAVAAVPSLACAAALVVVYALPVASPATAAIAAPAAAALVSVVTAAALRDGDAPGSGAARGAAG